MILSRSLARTRIAQGARPSWIAAWLPVAADFGCVVFLCYLLLAPFKSLMDRMDASIPVVASILLIVAYIPAQAVLIVSSLWATKSRWIDTDRDT